MIRKTSCEALRKRIELLEKQVAAYQQNDVTLQESVKRYKTLLETWKKSMERAQRNVERVKRLQDEINDIIVKKESEPKNFLTNYVNLCADLLEDIIENESGDLPLLHRVRSRIDKIFKVRRNEPEEISLNDFVSRRLEDMMPRLAHRHLKLDVFSNSLPLIFMPIEPMQKIIDGLVKNAVENTPDHGKIEIALSGQEAGVDFSVTDYGVGIIADHQRRIFEGFFTTQSTVDYSSKRSFDFNAGGIGADLLRMKIFSKQYGFSIDLSSRRCEFIPGKDDKCPGNINRCNFRKETTDCYNSGGSVFTVRFKF